MEYKLVEGRKLFPAKNVAEYFLIDSSTLNAWLRINDDFRNNPEYIVEVGGGNKPRRFFTPLGVSVYQNIKDKPRNNKQQEKKGFNTHYTHKKEVTAKKAYSYEVLKQQISQQDPTLMTLQIMMEIKTDNLALAEEARQLRDSIGSLQEQMRMMTARSQQAVDELTCIEAPTVFLQEPTKGIRVREVVNKYCVANGVQQSFAYTKLYQESYYRLQYNIDQRRKKSGLTGIEQAEKDGKIEELYALAVQLFT